MVTVKNGSVDNLTVFNVAKHQFIRFLMCICKLNVIPIIAKGTVRIWQANTYRLESTLNYGLERVWSMAMLKGSNNVALGYDEGSILIKVCIPLY